MNITFQNILRSIEVGKAEYLTRLIPFILTFLIIGAGYYFWIFHGLNDPQSMDNAQLARQIARGEGYTTRLIRPAALQQLRNYATVRSMRTGQSPDLYSPDHYPADAPRLLPDTCNPPGYPYVLATWFRVVRPHFDQTVADMSTARGYTSDFWIPPLNAIFLALTAALVFGLGLRLFNDRVAWLSLCTFVLTNLVWQFCLTAMSTTLLMLLTTGLLYCALEIVRIGEASSSGEEGSFGLAWIWALALGVCLGLACLTRLHLVVLLAPLAVLFLVMPGTRVLVPVLIAFVAACILAPWFWFMYDASGNPFGSNLPLLLLGSPGYEGNQIWCHSALPGYSGLLRDVARKEYTGFLWHFNHGWEMSGSNPVLLLFVVSLLHRFKRWRAQAFQWLLGGCAIILVATNSLGDDQPDTLGPWNTLVILLPGFVVVGSAFFFILFDRLESIPPLVKSMIVAGVLVITAFPLALTLTTTPFRYYCYPPYVPHLIRAISQFARPNEWVTTDMPWAAAWYGDRASLWLPDSLSNFIDINDNVCPTGSLFFSPVTWSLTLATVNTGEEKEWTPFMTRNKVNVPPTFPLQAHTATPAGGPDYVMWSDHARWDEH